MCHSTMLCATLIVSASAAVPLPHIQAAPVHTPQVEQPQDLAASLQKRCKERAAVRDFAELTRLHERMLQEGLADEFDRIALPTVLRSLAADDADVRVDAAALALHLSRWGFSGSRKELTCEERESLIEALDDDSARVASAAVLFLGRAECEADEAVPKILALAASTDLALRREASWSLALMARRSEIAAAAVLRGCREGPDAARAAIIGYVGLARSGGPAFVKLMYDLLEDPSDDIAGKAAVALARVDGSPKAGQAIARQVRVDRAKPARLLTALYQMRHHDPALVPHIVRAMQRDTQSSCVWGGPLLGDMGAAAKDALPALRAIADDPEVHVKARRYTRGAVKKIEAAIGLTSLPQWPADLPTHDLIERLPSFEEGAYGDQDGYGRPLAPPPWTITAARTLRERCEQDLLSPAEWRALVRRIVDDPATERIFWRTPETGRFWSFYSQLLGLAAAHDALPLPDRDRLDSRSYLVLELPDEWPGGVPLLARVSVRHWQGDYGRYTFFDTEGTVLHTGTDDAPSMGHHPAWYEWTDRLVPVTAALEPGTAPRPDVLIEFQDGDTWRVVRRYETPLATRVRGTIGDYVHPKASAAIGEALRSGLEPRLHIDHERRTVEAEIYPGRIASVIVAEGHPTIAVTIEARRGDTLVARGHAWWWAEDADSYYDGKYVQTRVHLTLLEPPALQGWWEGEGWTLRLVHHPETALRNLKQPVYWEGDVTIPVRPE